MGLFLVLDAFLFKFNSGGTDGPTYPSSDECGNASEDIGTRVRVLVLILNFPLSTLAESKLSAPIASFILHV